jgi:hypothetical protein
VGLWSNRQVSEYLPRAGFESPPFIFPRRGDKEKTGGKEIMTVRIRTEEFVRTGVRMYRVLSIRGVLTKDKLDPQYVGTAPSFWLTTSHKTIKMFDGATISVNGVYKSSVFCKLLNKIEVAGNRLHKLNQERYRAKKAKEAAVEKREVAKANDIPVGIKVFRI